MFRCVRQKWNCWSEKVKRHQDGFPPRIHYLLQQQWIVLGELKERRDSSEGCSLFFKLSCRSILSATHTNVLSRYLK